MAGQEDVELTSSHKYIYTWNSSHNTFWWESSGTKDHVTQEDVGRGSRTGPAPLGGSSDRGQVPAPRKALTQGGTGRVREGVFRD